MLAIDGGKYEDCWNRLRALKRSEKRLLAALLVMLVGIPLVLGAIDRIYGMSEAVRLAVGIPYILITLVVFALNVRNRWRIASFPCPRCGERFHRRAASRTCGHCGLFVYQWMD